MMDGTSVKKTYCMISTIQKTARFHRSSFYIPVQFESHITVHGLYNILKIHFFTEEGVSECPSNRGPRKYGYQSTFGTISLRLKFLVPKKCRHDGIHEKLAEQNSDIESSISMEDD